MSDGEKIRGDVGLTLSESEARALCWALDAYLPGLRYEEARVKLARDRHDMVVQEEILSALRERLRQRLDAIPAAAPLSAPGRG